MGGKATKIEEPLETAAEHTAGINCMTISEDRSLLVTGSDDMTARMWSTQTDNIECIGILRGHEKEVTCLALGDTNVFTGSADATIRKWDMTILECVFVYEGHTNRINSLLVTGEWVFSTSWDKTARMWMYDTDEQIGDTCQRIFQAHAKSVSCLVYVPSEDIHDEDEGNTHTGDLVITGSFDSNAISWSPDSGNALKVFRDHTAAILCMEKSKDGKTLFTGSEDKTVISWDISSGRALKTFQHDGAVVSLFFRVPFLFSGTRGMDARCHIANTGELFRKFTGHTNTVNTVVFYHGLLLTACGDSIARVYDAKSGELKREFKGHENAIISLAEVGTKFYTGSSDGTLKQWEFSSIRTPSATDNYDNSSDEEGMVGEIIQDIQIDSDQETSTMGDNEEN